MRSGHVKAVAVVLFTAAVAYWYGRTTKEEDLRRDAGAVSSLLMGLSVRQRTEILVGLINSKGIRPGMFGMHVEGVASNPGDRKDYYIRPYRSPFVGAHTAMFVVDEEEEKCSVLLCWNPKEKRYELSGGYMQPMDLKKLGLTAEQQRDHNACDRYDKNLAYTARREHLEETGLRLPIARLKQLETRSGIGQNKMNAHSVDAFYFASITKKELDRGSFGKLRAGDDVSKVKLVPMEGLSEYNIRRDHLEVIQQSHSILSWRSLPDRPATP
ncbi:MAG: NUDIX domain-containing protein [Coxiellaceae bacterium]|nr:NUDIX domain-containing protein [Coxiellaceae bacterium]